MLFPKKCSILFRIFLYFFLSFFILPWSSIRWWFAGCLLFPEIHDVLSFIYIEIAILADFFKGLYSYRIFIYYFCHILRTLRIALLRYEENLNIPSFLPIFSCNIPVASKIIAFIRIFFVIIWKAFGPSARFWTTCESSRLNTFFWI